VIKALVLEGPVCEHMRGWRHFQIFIRLERGQKISSCIGQRGTGEQFARQLRGKFFPVGSWEMEQASSVARVFPAPRPEILDLLVSERQPEMAL
jgi:hypothetical protein